jgi:hypothetical protein
VAAAGDPVVFEELFRRWVRDVVENDPLIVRWSAWDCHKEQG